MKTIALTRGLIAKVDDSCFEFLSKHKWQAVKMGNTFYASRCSNSILMHREIMGNPVGMEIDHINRSGLDNRLNNLRICTRSQNQHNRRKQQSSSVYKGVYWKKSANRWCSQIQVDRKNIFLGYFSNEKDASGAYIVAKEKMVPA